MPLGYTVTYQQKMIHNVKERTFWHVRPTITETQLFKYIENFTSKNWNVLNKKTDIFQISALNIDCGYSLEPPRRGGSNEYPQSMFLSRNKKMRFLSRIHLGIHSSALNIMQSSSRIDSSTLSITRFSSRNIMRFSSRIHSTLNIMRFSNRIDSSVLNIMRFSSRIDSTQCGLQAE